MTCRPYADAGTVNRPGATHPLETSIEDVSTASLMRPAGAHRNFSNRKRAHMTNGSIRGPITRFADAEALYADILNEVTTPRNAAQNPHPHQRPAPAAPPVAPTASPTGAATATRPAADRTREPSLAHDAASARRRDRRPLWVALPAINLPDKALKVGKDTTLPDLLNLIRRSDPKAGKHYFSCKMRSGEPHLSLVQSGAAASKTLPSCKTALLQILQNTRDRYALTPSMAAAMENLQDTIGRSGSPIRKHDISHVGQLLIGPSTAPRDTPRMPMDCLMHFIFVLEQADPETLSGTLDQVNAHNFVTKTLQDAKDHFLTHDLSPSGIETFFSDSAMGFWDRGLGELAELAGDCAWEMDKLLATEALLPRMRDCSGMVGSFILKLRESELILSLPPAPRRALDELLNRCWEKDKAGQLTEADAVAFFEQAEQHCSANGWQHQADVAKKCMAELAAGGRDRWDEDASQKSHASSNSGSSPSVAPTPLPHTDRFFYTRMHENLYGRAIETFLMRALREDPPAQMKESVAVLGAALARKFKHVEAGDLLDFREQFKGNRGSWFPNGPRIQAFIDADLPGPALMHALCAPVETGDDCMAVAFLANALIVSLGDKHPALNEWSTAAAKLYADEIRPVPPIGGTGRRDDRRQPVRHAGVTLPYQPEPVTEPRIRAHMARPDRGKPALDNPSVPLQTALEHGIPYAAGVSEAVYRMTHIVVQLQQQGEQLDGVGIAAALALCLSEAGEHSLHEACLALQFAYKHLLEEPENRKIEPADLESFTNYKGFFQYLYTAEPEGKFQALEDKVWQQAIEYYSQHGHYEYGLPPGYWTDEKLTAWVSGNEFEIPKNPEFPEIVAMPDVRLSASDDSDVTPR
jgi:hypothetical protein